MNSFIETILLFFKISAAVCCGCNTIDLYKEETNRNWEPIKQEIYLDYHKNKLKQMCVNILENAENKNYEIVFEYNNQMKINIKEIIENIDNLNIKHIKQLKKTISDYYKKEV